MKKFKKIKNWKERERKTKKKKIFKSILVLLNNLDIPNGKINLFMEQDRISRQSSAFCHFHI